jgi:hypothetical protein
MTSGGGSGAFQFDTTCLRQRGQRGGETAQQPLLEAGYILAAHGKRSAPFSTATALYKEVND